MTDEIAIIAQESLALRHELSVEEVVARVNKVHEVMRRAMVDGHHYGTIPGTPKPSLLKPGAELLCVMFRLDPQYTVSTERVGAHLTIASTCTLYHVPTGQRVGSGMGSCSTRESKYAYRQAKRACPKCGAEQINRSKFPPRGAPRDTEPGWYCYAKAGGCGQEFAVDDPAITGQVTGRVENEDVADQENTVLKMANKRSLVAAVLNVTAASDIFTQDLEDLPHESPVVAVKAEEPSIVQPFPPDDGPAEPVRQPNGEPVELIDRAYLIGQIKGAAEKAKMTAAQRSEYQRVYLGGASVDKADLSALSDMLTAIRARP